MSETNKSIDIRFIPVRRLEGRFIILCWEWLGRNRAKPIDLARVLGIHPSRIYELLNEDPSKRRPLTMFWVEIFVKKGVFSVAQIYDENPQSPEERDAWDYLKIIEKRELQLAIVKALRGTLDEKTLMDLLKTHFPKSEQKD